MGNDTVASVNIPENIIREIVTASVNAAVLASMKDPDKLISDIVRKAMSAKVDSQGKISDSYGAKWDWLEWNTQDMIRAAAKEALSEILVAQKELLKKAVMDEFNRPGRQKTVARAFSDAVEESFKCNWRFGCDIKFEQAEE
ncbi:MAG: hypothetical protein WC505_08050 [Patescibacteria group bacterium]